MPHATRTMAPFKVVTLLLALLLAWTETVSSVCDSLAHIDETCGLEVQFFGNRALKPNSNRAQFDANCRTQGEGVNCLTDYALRCLEERPGAMARTIMRSVKDHYTKRCKDKEYGAEFMEHNKCFDDGALFEQFHQCYDKWYHQMQQLSKLSLDVEKGIQSSCCIFHDFQRCIRDNNVQLCHDKNALFWDDTIDEVADDTVQLFCAQLKTPEECGRNFPKDIWDSINGPVAAMDAEGLKARGKFKSMFLVILDMVSQYKLKP